MDVVPANWPVGAGSDFRGIYDRLERRLVTLLGRGPRNPSRRREGDRGRARRSEPAPRKRWAPSPRRSSRGSSCSRARGPSSTRSAWRRGSQTPMFFGSALTNFGVHPFLERFLEMAPPDRSPRERKASGIDPVRATPSPASCSRSRRTWIRTIAIASPSCASAPGRFEKGVQTSHVRTGKPIRLTNSTLLMGKDRAEVEEAFAGDVVGLFDPGVFRIGDTLADEKDIVYAGIPIFAPESYMRVEVAGVEKRKALEKGHRAARAGGRRPALP